MLPGLIDAHAHISDIAAARVALLSGVTTARSAGVPMFADVALREMVKAGYLAGPDILAAGVHLQPRFEGPSDVLSDPRLFEFVTGLKTPEQIRRATQVNLDRGVDVIKTSATDRAGLPDTDRGTISSTNTSSAPSSRSPPDEACRSKRTRTATRAPPTPSAPACGASSTAHSSARRRSG